mmetsp:Transcript_25464/g.61341  ORF Transcript_25464/g.61341 Transcript_25464/m.61341 type:complete len:239 (-) Transcript_25464:300-1016(-)|eukprot:CAMPEP_0114500026 /NCGR_PEP_ID=MMETSP0109-20121206/7736_1 /TAXON_ID=29199 /ORGANISM="Chlorarachnion reptans, Strain CCCM449" /LENGTH=238 /DNA_ID=CAMNT_0001677643 /DNA_START=29 /DNA_END=745 /DNA_ORIENTATION=-
MTGARIPVPAVLLSFTLALCWSLSEVLVHIPQSSDRTRLSSSIAGGGHSQGGGVYIYPRLKPSVPGLRFRVMELADVPKLRKLNEASLNENYRQCWWEQYILSSTGVSLAVEEHETGEIVAYAVGLMQEKTVAEIVSVAVDWRWRQRGIGSSLIHMCIMKMQDRFNATEVRLYARSISRPWVRDLYFRMGFGRRGLLASYYDDGEDAEILACKICKINARNSSDFLPYPSIPLHPTIG